jgi:small-conductance mechanosensitive channel
MRGRVAAAALALLLAGAAPAAPSAGGAPGHAPADVTLGTRTVATLRAEVFAKPPALRAWDANRNLDELVRERAWDEIHVRTEAGGRIFLVGARPVFAFVPEDLDPEGSETLDAAAERIARNLSRGLAEMRERRDGKHLLGEAAAAAVATALLLVLLAGLRFLRRAAERRLVGLTERLASRLEAGGKGFVPLLWLTEGVTWAVRAVTFSADVIVAYLWLAYVLRRFPWTRPWGEQLGQFLLDTARAFGAGALRQVPDLFIVVAIALLTRFLSRLSDAFFGAIEQGRLKVSEAVAETTKPTRRIVTAVLWVFALIMAYPYLPGSGTEAFKGVSVVVGVMVSLGSTTIVGQVFSGFMLLYARVFRVGDFVRIGDVEGTVEAQGLFATKITTPWNDEMSIPNAVVAAASLRNYSRSKGPGGPLLSTRVTIGYDAPWRQVEALLLLAAERTDGLKKDPPPFVRHWALQDFYVEYELNARIERPEARIAILSALHARIQDAFNEHGVQIMSPHYLGDPASAKVVPPARWYPPPARPGNG